MKQIFLEKGTAKTFSVPTPLFDPGQILVKVNYSFISTGTEKSTLIESKKNVLQKALSNTTEKVNKVMAAVKDNGFIATAALVKGSLNKVLEIGYSCSGRVEKVGENVKNFKVGDLVACAGAGIANHAQYVAVPKNLAVKVSDENFLKQASLTTIGSIALQGVRRADVSLGEKVCVIGLGLIGQLTVQLAKLSGATVFGIDIDDSKLFLAQKFGCDHTYNSFANENIINEIIFHTQHRGVDKTIITASSKAGDIIQQSMEITRRKGKVVLVGDVKIDFDRNPFYKKEIDFLISCSYGPGRYDNSYEKGGVDYPYDYVRWTENRNMELFLKLVQEGKINVDPLISQEFDFDNAGEAYKNLMQKKSLGIVLKEDEQPDDVALPHEIQPIAYAKPYKAPENDLKIGFVGAGGFAKIKLLPIISKIKKTKICTIVDINSANAINIKKQYKAENFDNNFEKVLDNKNINALVIATPHFLHTDQTIAALSSGKAVFVEKPAAVNFEQYDRLKSFLEKNKDFLYCVDFNRSFAPFILKIKKVLKNRTSPLIIHYRMNAGFIPKDHWVQSEINGGRIIGEACHIFELFNFLTDANPVNFSVNSIDPNRKDLLKNDNFSVQISFDDGSICSLLYTAIGNKNLEKERMEIFFDGKSIVMEDYKKLYGYGLARSFDEKTKHQDKGHKKLIQMFFDAAKKGTPSPLSADRILMATKLSLEVDAVI